MAKYTGGHLKWNGKIICSSIKENNQQNDCEINVTSKLKLWSFRLNRILNEEANT